MPTKNSLVFVPGRWLEGTNCLHVTVMFEVFGMIFHLLIHTVSVTSIKMRARSRAEEINLEL